LDRLQINANSETWRAASTMLSCCLCCLWQRPWY
jgi:hypothetical protein